MVQAGLDAGLTNLDDVISHTPLGRLLEPSEVAEVLWLAAQPELSAVTGTEILVDGGFNSLTGF
jgi:L-rhamnose 1-dehydrogenase